MFFYFGYGSNLSVVSLRAKGVEPLSSEPAHLEGWRLVFNLPDFFAIEGGTGNIVPGELDEVVHGVLHGCRSADLRKLDELEALDVRYRRIEATVTAYDGRRVRAYVYVGLEHLLDDRCRPSERYRSILVRGATDMRLDPSYIEQLRNLPTCPKPQRGAFTPREHAALRVYSMAELVEHPTWIGLAGYVFDTNAARPEHDYLRKLLGGKDATLLFLKRMATTDGSETVDDVIQGRLTPEQRHYLDEYLHELAHEYALVGRLAYGEAPDARGFVGVTRTGGSDRPPRPDRSRWCLSFFGTGPARPGRVGPAHEVLLRAEAENEAAGHENAGSLSASHGFMPREAPRLSLPREYAVWDEIAAELPKLYASLRLRRVLEQMPELPADADHLPDEALLRAAQVLGVLSHAYHYVDIERPAGEHPRGLSRPWAEVRRRLGRPDAPVISYVDLIVNNWRLVDPGAQDPIRASNMRLLVPTVDNQEERIFYLTQTEILARASPIIGATVAAQEAVLAEDHEALESALVTITGCLQRITRESLLSIDPNPSSKTYVDPVLWAKTVAPFAVPFEPGVQGPSGTSSPIFNTLDVFLRRSNFQTFLGKEIRGLRSTYPQLWREFLAALGEVSVPDYVNARGSAHLRGLLKEVGDTYAGENGFLGRHRIKVYGYLELAFKVGRSVTIGGFQGVFKDRTWDQVDAELEKARRERTADLPQPTYAARVESVTSRGKSGVARVVLDVSGTGLRYETWDRCGVLPENDPQLVARTLRALGIDASELVTLTPEWRNALASRPAFAGMTQLTVEELLVLGKIRPLVPRAAEALHAVSQSARLKRLMDEQRTDRCELWDVLLMLKSEGFDPASLLRVEPGGKMLCEVVPPETFRMYSISSKPSSANTESPNRIVLNVGELSFQSPRADTGEMVTRNGTASAFLKNAAARSTPIPIIVEHPARFGLPKSARIPIVLIAGGTGIAPFLATLDDRSRDDAAAETLLLFGARSQEELVYDEQLAPALRGGHTSVYVALSREGRSLRYTLDQGDGVVRAPFKDGCARVPDLVEDSEVAQRLWKLLRSTGDGGVGAHVYVCGRSSFARSAIESLEHVFFRFGSGDEQARRAFARQQIRALFAEGRLKEETFSGEEPASGLAFIEASEVARHNDEENGYWLLIDQRVYDISEFVHRHAGGRHVLLGYAGMDATEGYNKVHAKRPEVDASREMHVIGVLRVLELRGRTADVITARGPRIVSLAAVYRAWLSALWLAVEMQNALRNDHAMQEQAATRAEDEQIRSPYRLLRAVETHERFLRSYLDVLTRDTLPSLGELTKGFFARIAALTERPSARPPNAEHLALVSSVSASLRRTLATLSERDAGPEDPERLRVVAACRVLEQEDMRVLAAIKEHVRVSVRLFEVHEASTPERAGAELVEVFHALEEEVTRYFERLFTRLRDEVGVTDDSSAAPTSREQARPCSEIRLLARNAHWTFEEDRVARLVSLRRSALPFGSIEELLASNDEIIACVRDDHASFGVVVDMRQAPGRNDPAFESAMRKLRKMTEERFARLSVLVESAAGLLQVSRLERSDGAEYLVTTSEIAAAKFARGQT